MEDLPDLPSLGTRVAARDNLPKRRRVSGARSQSAGESPVDALPDLSSPHSRGGLVAPSSLEAPPDLTGHVAVATAKVVPTSRQMTRPVRSSSDTALPLATLPGLSGHCASAGSSAASSTESLPDLSSHVALAGSVARSVKPRYVSGGVPWSVLPAASSVESLPDLHSHAVHAGTQVAPSTRAALVNGEPAASSVESLPDLHSPAVHAGTRAAPSTRAAPVIGEPAASPVESLPDLHSHAVHAGTQAAPSTRAAPDLGKPAAPDGPPGNAREGRGSCIDTAIATFFDRLSAPEQRKFCKVVLSKRWSTSSGCSGSGMAEVAFHAVLQKGGAASTQVNFFCENKASKRSFIKNVVLRTLDRAKRADAAEMPHRCCIFKEMEDMSQPSAACDVHGGPCQVVARSDFFICGFSCKDLSLLKHMEGSRASVLESAQGSSGKTFRFVIDHLSASRPRMVVLENVEALARDESTGNLPYLWRAVESRGYAGAHAVLSAMRYGLPQTRVRIFIVLYDMEAFGYTQQDMQCPQIV